MSDAPQPGPGGRIFAAAALGAAVGATTSAGNALLLYTGQGFLRAAGLLFSSTMLAIAAGVWAGAADEHDPPPSTRARWVTLVLTLLFGGVVTMAWSASAELRELALGGALAVLFILAVPAYTSGAVLSALHARLQHRGSGIAPAALGGAAIGVLVTTMLLIQNLAAFAIYYGAAVVMLLVGLTEARARPAVGVSATMNGRVAIITGVGDRGQLGFTLAQKFLAAGAHIVITDPSPTVEQLAAELSPAGYVAAVRADLTNDDDVARVVAAASERFGRLDALINAADARAITTPDGATTAEPRQHEIQRNADAMLRTSRAALPLLRESRGIIVNFASPAELIGAADPGVYTTAEAAVVALTRTLALEEKANGVRVNAIASGIIDTAQNRQTAGDEAALVSRDDVASVALFLAGPEAAGISGQAVRVGRTGPSSSPPGNESATLL